MDSDQLAAALAAHARWLENIPAGARADLREADLREADLQGANLWGANLRHADLRGADLWRADLRGADLWRANLREADLQGSDLREANLQYANLRGANLQEANLQGADLREADLQGANLWGANLRHADLDFSAWPLWCGSKGVRVDRRIAAQLAAHFCVLECDDPDYQTARDAVLPFARSSHRAEELGLISDIFPAPNNGPRSPGGWPVDDEEGADGL